MVQAEKEARETASNKRSKPIAVQLGSKIRQLRREKKTTLIELSHRTGVAQATLSRMETGRMTGTVESHRKIAESLGVSLATLYQGIDDRTKHTSYSPSSKPRRITAKTDRMKCELLTQEVSRKKITPLLITLASHGRSEVEELDGGVEKLLFVIEGNLKVVVGTEEFVLHPYDTLYFEASLPHHLVNLGTKQAKIFCAVSPSKI